MNSQESQVRVQVPPRWNRGGATIKERYAREAYKEYEAQFGSAQSFERIHERGGFGIEEIIGLLCNRIDRLEKRNEKLLRSGRRT